MAVKSTSEGTGRNNGGVLFVSGKEQRDVSGTVPLGPKHTWPPHQSGKEPDTTTHGPTDRILGITTKRRARAGTTVGSD